MSMSPLHTAETPGRTLFGPRRAPQPRRAGSSTPRDATPARRVPAPRYEALAIGLGCDHLGRHGRGRHR